MVWDDTYQTANIRFFLEMYLFFKKCLKNIANLWCSNEETTYRYSGETALAASLERRGKV